MNKTSKYVYLLLLFSLSLSNNSSAMEQIRARQFENTVVAFKECCHNMDELLGFVNSLTKKQENSLIYVDLSIRLADSEELEKIYTWQAPHKDFIRTISTIEINLEKTPVSRKAITGFGDFIEQNYTYLQGLIFLQTTNLPISKHTCEILGNISSLQQVELINADLSNDSFAYLLKLNKLTLLNVSNNKELNDSICEAISKKPPTDEKISLIIAGTSISEIGLSKVIASECVFIAI